MFQSHVFFLSSLGVNPLDNTRPDHTILTMTILTHFWFYFKPQLPSLPDPLTQSRYSQNFKFCYSPVDPSCAPFSVVLLSVCDRMVVYETFVNPGITLSIPTCMPLQGSFGTDELHHGMCLYMVQKEIPGVGLEYLYRCVFTDGFIHDLTTSQMMYGSSWYNGSEKKVVSVVLYDQTTPVEDMTGPIPNFYRDFNMRFRVSPEEVTVSTSNPFTLSVQRESDDAVGMCIQCGWSKNDGGWKRIFCVIFEGGQTEVVDQVVLLRLRNRFVASGKPPVRVIFKHCA